MNVFYPVFFCLNFNFKLNFLKVEFFYLQTNILFPQEYFFVKFEKNIRNKCFFKRIILLLTKIFKKICDFFQIKRRIPLINVIKSFLRIYFSLSNFKISLQ